MVRGVLVRVSNAVLKHDQKQLGEKSVYFILCFHIIVHLGKNSGQELKAGT